MMDKNESAVVGELVTAKLCGAAMRNHRCCLLKDHEGPHEARGREGQEMTTVRWSSREPVA
jgi:hypothetical protein